MIDLLKTHYSKLFFTMSVNTEIRLEKEKEDGFIEYKRSLVHCDDNVIHKYATQMQWRIKQNRKKKKKGFAIYYLGVDDDGSIYGLDINEIILSIEILLKITSEIGASVKFVNIIETSKKSILRVSVRLKHNKDDFLIDF